MEIKINVRKQVLTCRNSVIAGSVNYLKAHFFFDEPWEEVEKHVIFSNGEVPDVEIILDSTDICTIPWEVLIEGELFVSVVGYAEGDVVITTKLMDNPIIVMPHGEMGGGDPHDPTPSLWTRMLAYIDSVCEKLANKVTEFTGDETDTQYPSAKLVADTVDSITGSLDGKLDKSGGTMSGDLNMGLKKIKNMAFDPNNDGDTSAVTRKYVDYLDAFNEKLANKVTTFTGSETDTQYPSAKLVADIINSLARTLQDKLDKSGGAITGDLQISNGARIAIQGSANSVAISMASKRIGTLGNPQVSTDAANKSYVDTQDALNEKLANKATTLDNADNVKYPTTLAVKNAIDAIPVSPATRYGLTLPKTLADTINIAVGGDNVGPYAYVGFSVSAGNIVNDAFVPSLDPDIPVVYDSTNEDWIIDPYVEASKGLLTVSVEGTEQSLDFDTVEISVESVEDNEVTVRVDLLFHTETDAEAQQTAEELSEYETYITHCSFLMEKAVRATLTRI